MGEITTVGLDLAKRVVSVCGEDASGRVAVRRTLRREAVLAWFVQRRACVVGMEACASAHWFARELEALGHRPRIIAPEFVRPFRLSGKNDANDAAAICAAAALAGVRSALADETLPPALRRSVARQLEHLRELDARLAECDREWPSPRFPDTSCKCEDVMGGVGWQRGHTQRSIVGRRFGTPGSLG